MSRSMPRIERLFDHTIATHQSGYLIACGSCGKRDILPTRQFRNPPPFEVYSRHFHRAGWDIGSIPRKDKCPDCVGREMRERRAKHQTPQPTFASPAPNVVALNAPQPAYHFGPSLAHIKALQARFAHGPTSPEAIEARLKVLRDEITARQSEYRVLERRYNAMAHDVVRRFHRTTKGRQ